MRDEGYLMTEEEIEELRAKIHKMLSIHLEDQFNKKGE